MEFEGLPALYMTGFDANGLGTDTMRVSFNGVYSPPVAMEVGPIGTTQAGIRTYFYDEDDNLITVDDGNDYKDAYAVTYFSERVYSGIEFTFDTNQNGDLGKMNIDIASLPHKLVVGSVMRLQLPGYNQNYVGYGVNTASPMMSGATPPDAASATSDTVDMGSPTLEYVDSENLNIAFYNTEEVPAGEAFHCEFGNVQYPGNYMPISGFEISFGNADLQETFYGDFMTMETSEPGVATGATVSTGEKMDGVLQSNVEYNFSLTIASPIPMGGFFAITVPTEIGVPASPSTDMTFVCSFCSSESAGTIVWDADLRHLQIKDLFPDSSDYLYQDSIISFTIGGWTNPATT
jgi:hypothetical protein